MWQRTGGLARGLVAAGVRSVVVGELAEEWYLYAIAHPVSSLSDVEVNLERYYAREMAQGMLDAYFKSGGNGGKREGSGEEMTRVFGDVLSEGQVYLPVRLFARDMLSAGFPLVRYEIRWTPEQLRPLGAYVYGPSALNILTKLDRLRHSRNRPGAMGFPPPFVGRRSTKHRSRVATCSRRSH